MYAHTLYCRSPSFFLSLEHAILHGQAVMMHPVDTMRVDPSLITLLDCNYTSSAGQQLSIVLIMVYISITSM